MIDTHAHLDACIDPPEVLVERAREAGVDRILTVGTTVERCREALALADEFDEVAAIVGVHPHNAADGEDVEALRELLGRPGAVAVGETGLDFFRDYAPRDLQRRVFEQQLELANESGLPVFVHSRGAETETLEVLAGFDGDVVLHCFSSPAMLPAALERGYYVSFAGNVTYPNATALRLAATTVPAERILAETDCPYLAPQPRRGRPNEPANVVHTVAALAGARREEPAELERRIEANAVAVFRL